MAGRMKAYLSIFFLLLLLEVVVVEEGARRSIFFAAVARAAKNFLIFEMNCELFQILLLSIQFLNMHQPVLLCNT